LIDFALWYSSAPKGKVSCDKCEEAYFDDPPCNMWNGIFENAPCHEIKRPDLMFENAEPFEFWLILHQHARDVGFGFSSIRLEAIIMLCEAYESPREYIDKILLIEKLIYPKLLKN